MKLLAEIVALVLLVACVIAQDSDIRRPPSILDTVSGSSGDDILFVVEQEVILVCEASGVPHPTITWLRRTSGQSEFSEIDRRQPPPNISPDPDESVGTIRIKPATSLDEGEYRCQAENDYGKALSPVFKLLRVVLDKDTTDTTPTEYTVKEGDPFRIPCTSGKSIPPPTYSWMHSERAIDENQQAIIMDKRTNIDENGNLFFSYIKKQDAQNGHVYRCNIYNKHQDTSTGGSYARITVIPFPDAPPRIPEIQYRTTNPEDSSLPVIALLGQELKLKCLFSSNPETSINWGRNSGQLPHSSRKRIEEHSTMLIISDLRESDEDVYYCEGSNKEGSDREHIDVKVQAKPVFERETHEPHDMNVTVGTTAEILCQAFAIPLAEVSWFINGEPLKDLNKGQRYEVSPDNTKLTIRDVCKSCPGSTGETDLQNIQCEATNVHGTAYAGGYLNVLETTYITLPPWSQEITPGNSTRFQCEAISDESTPVTITWLHEDNTFYEQPNVRFVDPLDNSLHINTEGLDEEESYELVGKYTCVASNGYSEEVANAKLVIQGVTSPVATAGVPSYWWIFIIIAIILLILIFLLCCCLCLQKNKGDSYPVDEKERKGGHDPEKELADSGFQDYKRPEDFPIKGSRASLSSSIPMGSDDEQSLAEYGDIDTGKFNEDGSFIGQYINSDKKRAPHESTI